MRWEELSEQPCSLARVLAIVGDRWTLLVLRDCFLGVRRFDDFERSLGVTRHVLADRLKRLVEAEILAKIPYQERPLREEYRLTEKGMELYPAILSLVNWGDRHLAGVEGPPLEHVHKHCGQHMHGVLVCSECGEPLHARDVTVREGLFWKGRLLRAAERSRPGRRRESADNADGVTAGRTLSYQAPPTGPLSSGRGRAGQAATGRVIGARISLEPFPVDKFLLRTNYRL